jgi:HK97 family phage prohead protease
MLAPNSAAEAVVRPRVALTPDGAVEGYASLFGEIDQARDMVMPGAFARTLRERDIRRIPMLFQHDPAEPVGIWLELREDHRGLYARGQLIPEVMRARELLALLRAGTADGLSIGFRTRGARVDPKMRIRRLHDIELWEISLVTFPLLAGARLHAVKERRPFRVLLPRVAQDDARLGRSYPRSSFARKQAEREWARVAAPSLHPSKTRAAECARFDEFNEPHIGGIEFLVARG